MAIMNTNGSRSSFKIHEISRTGDLTDRRMTAKDKFLMEVPWVQFVRHFCLVVLLEILCRWQNEIILPPFINSRLVDGSKVY